MSSSLSGTGDSTSRLTSWLHQPLTLRRTVMLSVLLCLVLRLPFAGAALNIDEGGMTFIAHNWLTSHGNLYGQYWLDRPPLLLVLYGVASIAGHLGVRALGALAAVTVVVSVTLIADRVGGLRAARVAGPVAAMLLGSLLLGSVFTFGELLGAAPVSLSVLALVSVPASTHPRRLLIAAGLCAACALLIKQSFVDGVFAGGTFLVLAAAFRRETGFRPSWPVAYIAGFAAPLAVVAAWIAIGSVGWHTFWYAMVGFRMEGFQILQQSSSTPFHRLLNYGLPVAFGSGIGLVLLWSTAGLWKIRSRIVVAGTLAAWLAGGLVGIFGGGNYFPHYFIQAIPAVSVIGALALVRYRRRLATTTLAALAAITILNVMAGEYLMRKAPPQQSVLTVANFLRAHSNPADTVYVMYARANLLYYAGLRSPFPYHWSLMDKALPSTDLRLRSLLRSKERPTWVVQWQTPVAFQMDFTGSTLQVLRQHYRLAAVVCRRRIYIRTDAAVENAPIPREISCDNAQFEAWVAELGSRTGLLPAGRKVFQVDQLDYLWS